MPAAGAAIQPRLDFLNQPFPPQIPEKTLHIANIAVNTDLPANKREKMFAEHAAWFKKHFPAGHFLMLGPYINTDTRAGVIFAHVKDHAELDKILAEDCLLPGFSRYDIRKFAPKMIADDIGKAKIA